MNISHDRARKRFALSGVEMGTGFITRIKKER
jgi:hypothetical protein